MFYGDVPIIERVIASFKSYKDVYILKFSYTNEGLLIVVGRDCIIRLS